MNVYHYDTQWVPTPWYNELAKPHYFLFSGLEGEWNDIPLECNLTLIYSLNAVYYIIVIEQDNAFLGHLYQIVSFIPLQS